MKTLDTKRKMWTNHVLFNPTSLEELRTFLHQIRTMVQSDVCCVESGGCAAHMQGVLNKPGHLQICSVMFVCWPV